MSYQQPPGGGGFPPAGYQQQQPQPQQPQSQGYPMGAPNPAYLSPVGATSAASIVQLVSIALLVLGLVLRTVVGLLSPGSGGAYKVNAFAALLLSAGLLGMLFVLLGWARDKDIPVAVRAVIAGVSLLVIVPIVFVYLR